MKQSELITLGLAGLAVYFILKAKGGGDAGEGLRAAATRTSEIFASNGQTFDNGWRYFSDGTSIDPAGNYYQNGNLIWNNHGAGAYI